MIGGTNTVGATLEALYPVGSIYLGTMQTCPLAALIPGSTWTLVASDKVLQGSGTNAAGDSVAAGLPNITGQFGKGCLFNWGGDVETGALYTGSSGSRQDAGGTDSSSARTIAFDASRSNNIYGASDTVQPPAYVVNIWQRTL